MTAGIDGAVTTRLDMLPMVKDAQVQRGEPVGAAGGGARALEGFQGNARAHLA